MTARQEKFVTEYIKDANATQAAIRAGFSKKTARQIGARLLTVVDVATAIAELRGPVREAAQVTLEGHLRELASLRDRAAAELQFAPAITAETNRGKAAGLYVERQLVETRQLPQMVIE